MEDEDGVVVDGCKEMEENQMMERRSWGRRHHKNLGKQVQLERAKLEAKYCLSVSLGIKYIPHGENI